ncbi:MAG: glycosyltransferase family 2 protein [Chloroflexota bacterium]|nr:glycosyltransferase family 2 protein [Chloroflexota bacterium]
MSPQQFPADLIKAPVALFLFKRPEQTARVFEVIRQSKPARLYLIADGPGNADETEICRKVRALVEQVDWDCEVKRNYAETNLGLRNRLISGMDWLFEREERAIILEDDCLPHPSFFRFCEELLEHYKDDPRIMHINGNNFLRGRNIPSASYYFSKYAHVWGWATWRRAWLFFRSWDTFFPALDLRIFRSRSERDLWTKLLGQLRSNGMDHTWDYQWALVCMAYKSLCIMPKNNLVSNIGFGQAATHTQEESWLANMPLVPMEFPLTHPKKLQWNMPADQITAKHFFNATDLRSVVKSFLFRSVKGILSKVAGTNEL